MVVRTRQGQGGVVSESPGKVSQMISALPGNPYIQSCIFSMMYPSLQGRDGRGERSVRGAQFENSSQRILQESSLPHLTVHSPSPTMVITPLGA